jgi:putative DNA primase/helicase
VRKAPTQPTNEALHPGPNGQPPPTDANNHPPPPTDGAAAGEGGQAEQKKHRNRHFTLTAQGVFYTDEESGSKIWICSPLKVTALARDSDSESWGRLLQWADEDGHEHQWTMPMSMLAADAAPLREVLLSRGLNISSKYRHRLSEYVQSERPDRRVTAVSHVGWNGRIYVLPDSSIPQNTAEELVFQTASRIENPYTIAGTLREWQNRIGRLCIGNSRMLFSVSCAFAPLLLQPLGVESGGFHFTGTTSTGKSTLQLVAGSVLGGGRKGEGFACSWRTTANALEAIAEAHNDALLLLDEIREISDARELDGVVYMLCHGRGKARLNRSIVQRPTLSWRLLFLSTGEIKLSEHAATAGSKIKAGVETRLVNLPSDAGAGMGVFENLHGFESPRAFAEQLRTAVNQVYGIPSRIFLEHFIAEWDTRVAQATAFMDDFMKKGFPPHAAPEVGRALRRFALVAAAGEMATDMGITAWRPDEARRAALRHFEDWIRDRGGIGQADVEAGVRQVRAFLETHGASRFQSIVVRDARDERVLDRAGYWKEENGERLFLVFPEAFQSQLCRGLDYKLIAKELLKRKLLLRGDDRNLTRQERVPEGGKLRFYAVRSQIFEHSEIDEQEPPQGSG